MIGLLALSVGIIANRMFEEEHELLKEPHDLPPARQIDPRFPENGLAPEWLREEPVESSEEFQRLFQSSIDDFLSRLTPGDVLNILTHEADYLECEHHEKYRLAVELSLIVQAFPTQLSPGTEKLRDAIRESADGQGMLASCRAEILVSLIDEKTLDEKLRYLRRYNGAKSPDERVRFPRGYESFLGTKLSRTLAHHAEPGS